MYSLKRILVFFLIFLIIDIEFLWVKCSFAADSGDQKFSMSNVDANAMKASNPNCQLSRAITEIVFSTLTAAVALLVVGFVLEMSVIGSAIGTGIILAAVASFAGIIFATPGYFACKWSFVRHPVMRDSNDKNIYLKCEDPLYNTFVDKGLYEACANREYGDEKQYYQCLGKGDEVLGKKYEPTCPNAKYVQENEYYWPKNRISRSKYIEFCYRLPIGEGLLIAPLVENAIAFQEYNDSVNGPFTGEFNDDGSIKNEVFSKGENKLYPREAYSTPNEDSIKTAKSYIFGGNQCFTLEVGEYASAYSMKFQAFEKNDKICVNAVSSAGGAIPISPQPEIGCHMRPAGKPVPMCAASAKFPLKDANDVVTGYDNTKCQKKNIYQSCYGVVGSEVKSVFPVTSMIVSCIKESIDNLLESDEGLNSIRIKMQKSVRVVLILALMLFALKAILGGLQSTAEVYILIIKFAVVIYMATGEGVIENYRKKIVNLTTGLSDIVMSVDKSQKKPCDFSQDEYNYISNKGDFKNRDFRYLAIWDRLDCKMAFYLGSQLNSSAATTTVLFLVLSGAVLLVAVLVAQNVLVCLVALLVVIMIILIVMSIVYLYILSLLGLAILAMIAPLMLPMLLFQVTKQFFDGWIRSIVTFSLYPVIMFSFLSLVFTVFDKLYFGDLEFERTPIQMLDQTRIGFTLSDKDSCTNMYNSDSKELIPIGCIVDSMSFVDMGFLFGLNLTVLDNSSRFDTKYVWTSLGLFLLMAFLFYHFLQIVSDLAAELSGSPRLSFGIGAASTMQKFLSSASSFSNKTSSAAAGLANSARKALSPDSEKSSEKLEGEKK